MVCFRCFVVEFCGVGGFALLVLRVYLSWVLMCYVGFVLLLLAVCVLR